MDKLGFAGLLSTLYDSARVACKVRSKKALLEAWEALPSQDLPEEKSKALRLSFMHLQQAQVESEAAVEYLQEYYGIKPKKEACVDG
jgi:hypothetical protein